MVRVIVDQCNSIGLRIRALPELARAAVAVGAASRLMDQHLRLPEEQRIAFTVTWAGVIALLWEALSNPSAELNRSLNTKLKEYYSGPYCHELGEDARPGADEDAASAAIYATEAYCTSSIKAATCAAMQLLTDAEARADAIAVANGEDAMATNAAARRFRFQQIELDRLDSVVSLLEQEGLTEETLPRLRKLLTAD